MCCFAVFGITGIENIYNISSSARVTCFSNFTVERIRWIKPLSKTAITQANNSNEQTLILQNIARGLNGMVFTCEAVNIYIPTIGQMNKSKNFTILTEETCK